MALLLLMAVGAEARIVKGKIKDVASGEEIIGASIVIKNVAGKGTATGLDGSFQLTLQRFPCTLVCSYLGYKTKEVVVNHNDDNLNIDLEADACLLYTSPSPRDS